MCKNVERGKKKMTNPTLAMQDELSHLAGK